MISSDKFAVIIRWQKFLGPVMYSNLTLPPNRYWFFFFCGWSSLLCMNQTDNILSHSPRAITLIVRILVNVPVFYISVVLVSSQAVFNDKRCFLPADSCSVSEYAQARRDHFFFLSERKKGSLKEKRRHIGYQIFLSPERLPLHHQQQSHASHKASPVNN